MDKFLAAIFGAVMGMLASLFIHQTSDCGRGAARTDDMDVAVLRLTLDEQRREAVEAGIGRYALDEKTGHVQFVWGCGKCGKESSDGDE